MKILLFVPSNRYRANVARDLVYGCWCKGNRIGGTQFPPTTLLLLGTMLKNAGHDVRILDAQCSPVAQEVLNGIVRETEVVIVLTSTPTLREDNAALLTLKAVNPRVRTVVFGSHPTFMPGETLRYSGIDFIIRGEPEAVVTEFIGALKTDAWRSVSGIGYKDGDRIVLNGDCGVVKNLDHLPIPDRTLLENGTAYDNPVVLRLPYTTMLTSRGCPGRCTFCTVPAFYRGGVKLRSADNVVEELRQVAALGYKEVFFRDEMFTISRERTLAVCERMKKEGIDLSWVCSTKVGTIDPEMMKVMKQAGCHMIRLGVESGVDRILANIQKDITTTQVRETFGWARKAGLDTHAHCMIGLPGETEQDVRETVRFVKGLKPTIATFGICTLLPGSRLFQEFAGSDPGIGDGSECGIDRLHSRSFYNEKFSSLRAEALDAWIRRAYRSFYLDPGYLLRQIAAAHSGAKLKRMLNAGFKVLKFSFRDDR